LSLRGKVAIVTGSGGGLGRAEALALAAAGADVVVNDIDSAAAAAVADEVERVGAKAVSVAGDVGERATADALVDAALGLGGLHVVVNNAGVLRDRMLFSMSDEEWDLVVRVHLRGHFLLSRNAAAYWRELAKETGAPVYGRIVNTTSEAFLIGSVGQPNYAAAKAGIVALTVSTSRALRRYGVTANAICPRARTPMTESAFGPAPSDAPDPLSPEHVAQLVTYLAGPAGRSIDCQVFLVRGGLVALLAHPTVEQRFDAAGERWTLAELDAQVGAYFAGRDPERTYAFMEVLDL
jgi:3-oxoacyl-[acyl-carrier protein] reductase